MDIESFESLVKSENKARLYFVRLARKNSSIFCARCGGSKLYRIVRKRYRCKICGHTFHDLSGRWINKLNISYKDWLWVIKLFELELSAKRIGEQVGISYPTALKAATIIRLSLMDSPVDPDLLGGEIELDESYFGGRRKGKRGRGAAAKVPVFGILERDGAVRVEAIKDVSAKTLLSLTIKTVRRGSVVYTDKYRSYDSLMFCGYRHLKIDHGKKFASGKVYINGIEGFWSYAKERLIKHHGVSKEKFPLYLKEMEFRYNHRGQDIFSLIGKNLVNLVPNLL
jgi:transposase